MKRRDRGWPGGMSSMWALGGLLLVGALARGQPPPPLADQLLDLGRRAAARGAMDQAETFYREALTLDPGHAGARLALQGMPRVRRVARARSTAGGVADGLGRPARARIEVDAPSEAVLRQRLTDDVGRSIRSARALVHEGRHGEALQALRAAQTAVRSAARADESARAALARRVQAKMIAAVRSEERDVREQAEASRLEAAAEQKVRALDHLAEGQEAVRSLAFEFDNLMAQGVSDVLADGGLGDIAAAAAPFSDARLLAQSAVALDPGNPAPLAGLLVATTADLLARSQGIAQDMKYQSTIAMRDLDRASIPFAGTTSLEYPDAERWRALFERPIERYGKAVDLRARESKTRSIHARLAEPVSMSFAAETPLEDVLKYIKSATLGPGNAGIPIYVDPVGLDEVGETMHSPVTLELEGVPLKTTLRLLLKQLRLTYIVKDGLLTITSESSEDRPAEARIYPVADLTLIPMSLVGGGLGGFGGGGLGSVGTGGGFGLGGNGGGIGGGGFGWGWNGGGIGGGGISHEQVHVTAVHR